MTLVKDLVTEMSILRTSTIPPSNVTPTMLPFTTSPPLQVYPSSQHSGGYPWSKDIITLQFTPPQFTTQASPGVYTFLINITPVQPNHQML